MTVAAIVGPAVTASPAAAAGVLEQGHFVLQDFGTAQGWNSDRHLRVLADITGDGRADIIGFGESGVATAVANGTGGFNTPRIVIHDDLAYNQGWRVKAAINEPRTPRFVTDITGDGRADIVGVGLQGIHTAVATGDGGFGPAIFWPNSFSVATCQNVHAADVNGDRRSDLVCVPATGTLRWAIALTNGGFAAPKAASGEIFPVTSAVFKFADVTRDGRAEMLVVFVNENPFVLRSAMPRNDDSYPGVQNAGARLANGQTAFSFQISDINGDGCADLVAFIDVAARALSSCNGTFQPYGTGNTNFGANQGWDYAHKHLAAVTDITRDGRGDITAFGDAGVYTGLGESSGNFSAARFVIRDFGYDQGWRVDVHPRYVADITGDGRPDIVGFGNAGIYTAIGQGDGTFA